MDSEANLYNNADASAMKRMTLQPAYNTGAPEALIGPETKKQIDKLSKTFKKQQVIGLIVFIAFLTFFFGHFILGQVQNR